ncbi:MAG: hypothetical protein O2830_05695, partial [Verrucomicrobia bacterium]|nr:hypothetical protein [Verrucomicrobiota bacterium]
MKAVTEEPFLDVLEPVGGRAVTYSRSITLVLTHDCPWHCRYCGFRSDGEGLLSDGEMERIIREAQQGGAREALLISGERPGGMPHIQEELARRGYGDFWEFANRVA